MVGARTVTRLLLLVALAAVVLGKPEWLKPTLQLFSPFVNLSTIIANRTLTLAAGVGLAVLLACVAWRRFFCRWLCPLGLACEACAKLFPNRPAPARFRNVGKWLALLTIGGSAASVPFFLWLDPLVLLSGAMGAVWPSGQISLGLLIAAIVLSAAFTMAWRRMLCPLCGLQELLAAPLTRSRAGDVKAPRNSRRAFLGLSAGFIGGLIISRIISPIANRLRPPGTIAEERFKTLCIRCGNCVRICPSGIIEPDMRPPDAAGLLAPAISFAADYCRQDCNRCGQGCPSGAIEALGLAEKNRRRIGLAHIDMPACRLSDEQECSICSLTCPAGAIEEVFDRETYSYTLQLDRDKCNGCGRCELECPEKAIQIQAV